MGCCWYGSCLRCLRCCRLGCMGGGNVRGLCSLKVAKAVASACTLSIQPGVMGFCCLSPGKVIVLDFCEEPSKGCDEGVLSRVFLCSCRRSEAPNPIGCDGLLVREEVESRETWEVGSVAARTFGCGGVGCGEEAAGSRPRKHGASAGSKQRGCGCLRLNHNRWPGVTGAFWPDGLAFTRPCKIFQAKVFKNKRT